MINSELNERTMDQLDRRLKEQTKERSKFLEHFGISDEELKAYQETQVSSDVPRLVDVLRDAMQDAGYEFDSNSTVSGDALDGVESGIGRALGEVKDFVSDRFDKDTIDTVIEEASSTAKDTLNATKDATDPEL